MPFLVDDYKFANARCDIWTCAAETVGGASGKNTVNTCSFNCILISVAFEWVHVNKVKCTHLNSSLLLMVVGLLLK